MLKSTTLDKIKKQIIMSAMGNTEGEDNFSISEKFLFYRYMAAVSNRQVSIPTLEKDNIHDYLTTRINNLFSKEGMMNDDFKNIIKHLTKISAAMKNESTPQDNKGWARVINHIDNIINNGGILPSLKEQILFAAVGLCIIEAESMDYNRHRGPNTPELEYSTKALKSLNELVHNDIKFSSLITFLNITDAPKLKNIPQLEFLALRKKYVGIRDEYRQQQKEFEIIDRSRSEYCEAYAKDADIIANLISTVLLVDNINCKDTSFGNTLLTWACTFTEGDPDLARAALNAGIDVNRVTNGVTSAVYATKLDSPEILTMLLESKRLNISSEIISSLNKAAESNHEYKEVLHKYFPEVNNMQPVMNGFDFNS